MDKVLEGFIDWPLIYPTKMFALSGNNVKSSREITEIKM